MESHLLPAFLAPDAPLEFPADEAALTEPNGLIAIGGNLSSQRLLTAYRRGIFPWYEVGQPVLWWTPTPRCVLFPASIHVSRSLRKKVRCPDLKTTFDQAFDRVIRACAEPRAEDEGTWIIPEMIEAYENLHHLGYAHSVEVWRGGELVGGLYGVALGAAFFGESMFCRESNASKIALVTLCRALEQQKDALIDCQVVSNHLLSLGAEQMPRQRFRDYLARAVAHSPVLSGEYATG